MAGPSFGELVHQRDAMLDAEEKKQTLNANSFGELVHQRDRELLTKQIIRAQQIDPDLYARAREAAGGLPPELVIDQLEGAEETAAVQWYTDFFEQNPRMRAWAMTDEEALLSIKRPELEGINSIGDFFGAAGGAVRKAGFESGLRIVDTAELAELHLRGVATPEQVQQLEQLMAVEGDRPEGNWVTEGMFGAAEQAPILLHLAAGGLKGAAIGAGLGFLAAGPAGLATGATAGGAAGVATDSFFFNSSLAFTEFLQFRDENGQPLDIGTARLFSWLAGAPVALLDTLGLGLVLQQIPGVNLAIGGSVRAGMLAALRNPGFRGAMVGFAERMGVAAGGEIATEMMQEWTTFAVGEMAKIVSGEEFPPATQQDLQARLTNTFVQMSTIMSIIGPIVAAPGIVTDLKNTRGSALTNEKIRQAAAALAAVQEYLERDPTKAVTAINAAALNQQVFLQEDELMEYFQSAGLDPVEVAIPGWEDLLKNAREGDGIVQMTLGDFFVHLVKDPADHPLLDIVRGAPEGYSNSEIRASGEAYLNLLRGGEKAPAQTEGAPGVAAAPVEPPPLSPQAQVLVQQFEEAGFQTTVGEDYARFADSIITTMAKRTGQQPDAVWERINLSIMRGGGITPEDLLQDAWHGSPALPFPRFQMQFMGSGQGAQSFGAGMYFAQVRSIAEGYRVTESQRKGLEDVWGFGELENVLTDKQLATFTEFAKTSGVTFNKALKSGSVSSSEVVRLLETFARVDERGATSQFMPADREKLAKRAKAYRELAKVIHESGLPAVDFTVQKPGTLFNVELPENDELAKWDFALDQQPPKVLAILKSLPEWDSIVGGGNNAEIMTFEDFYRGLMEKKASPSRKLLSFKKAQSARQNRQLVASKYLASKGLAGHRFLDAFSRTTAESDSFQFARQMVDKFGSEAAALEHFSSTDKAELQSRVDAFLASIGIANPTRADYQSVVDAVEIFRTGGGLELTSNFVIYDDTRIQIKNVFRQEAKGSITFLDDATVIKVFQSADLSTVLHEFGHLFFKLFVDLAKESPALAADLEVLRKSFGFTDFKLDREAHEKFARTFESYLMSGVAPNKELEGIFNRFRSWLLSIYMRVRGKLPKVTPEVKEVFDRMVATEQQIKDKTQLREYELKTAEELGLEPEAYATYIRHLGELRQQSLNNLHRSYVGDATRWFEGWMVEVYDQIKKDVRAKLLSKGSPYKAWNELSSGTIKIDRAKYSRRFGKAAADALPINVWGGDSDINTLAGLMGFPSAPAMAKTFTALPPLEQVVEEQARDIMRERHGMSDLDRTEFLNTLALSAMHTDARTTVLEQELKALRRRGRKKAEAPAPAPAAPPKLTPQEEVDEENYTAAVEAVIEEQKASKGFIQRSTGLGYVKVAAMQDRMETEGIISPAGPEGKRTVLVTTRPPAPARPAAEPAEPAAAAAAPKQQDTVISAEDQTAVDLAKDVARRSIRRHRVGVILSGQKWIAGYKRYGDAADRAVAKGDFIEAAEWKRKQLIVQEMIREGNKVRKEIERLRKKALRFSQPRRFPKDVDTAFAEQIRELVDKFDFTADARRGPLKVPLGEFQKAQGLEGNILDINPFVMQTQKVGFAQLTLEQLEGVAAALDSLEHAGRRENQVRIDNELKAWEDQLQRLLDQTFKFKVRFTNPGALRQALNSVSAGLTKSESLIKMLDGGDINGPWSQIFMRPIKNGEAAANAEMSAVLLPIAEMLHKAGGGILGSASYWSHKEEIVSLGRPNGQPQYRTRNEIMMTALIGGTNAGFERLDKLGIRQDVYDEMISKLSPADIEIANGIWAILKPYTERMNQRLARITGVKPSSVVARPNGPLTGGWVPLTEDYSNSRVVSELGKSVVFDNKVVMGLLKRREADTDVPLVFNLDTLTSRMHDIIWTLNMREPIKQANKVLKDKNLAAMLERVVGKAQVDGLRGQLKYLANQIIDEPLSTSINKILDHMRIGTAGMSLAFNLGTVGLQPLGFFNSIEEIGGKWMLRGFWDFMSSPTAVRAALASPFLKTRFNNLERDMQANYRQAIAEAGKLGTLGQQAIKFGYQFLKWMDWFVAVPTWMGGYAKHIASHPADDLGAMAFADRAVRLSQGSAAPSDLVYFARKPGLTKWVTMFYTWLSALYNQIARLVGETRSMELKDLPSILARWTGLVVMPAVITMYFNAFRFGEDDEDDPKTSLDALKAVATFPLATIPIARTIASLWEGFPSSMAPVEKSFESFAKLIGNLAGLAGDQDPNWRAIYGDSLQVVGTVLHLPLRPLKNLGLDWFDMAEEGEMELTEKMKFFMRGQL